MKREDFDITIEYVEHDGILIVTQNGVVKKTQVKKDSWGDPDLRFVDLAYLAVQLTDGSGKDDYWVLDADEQDINKQRLEKDHSFVIHHIGKKKPPFADGYIKSHYEGSQELTSFVYLSSNPEGNGEDVAGIISDATATIVWDTYFLASMAKDRSLALRLPVYLEFINHKNRKENETIIRIEFVENQVSEWEPEWIDEDADTGQDENNGSIEWIKFV